MSKKTIKEEVVEKTPKKKVKAPKFKLISYTIKATIPTGQYANICPEVTVQAETIEAAERAVMPYIETLFARYRDGGPKPVEPTSDLRPIKFVEHPLSPITNTGSTPSKTPTPAPVASPQPIAPAIVLTVPFTRAKDALMSCTSLDAFELVIKQIRASTKLISSEKVELEILAAKKFVDLNGTKA